MDERYGIVTPAHCYLRSGPGTGSRADQTECGVEDEIFSGWAVRLFPETEKNGWVKVETHYGYQGYVPRSALGEICREELEARQDRHRFQVIGAPEADLLNRPKVQGLPLELLLKHAVVEVLSEAEDIAHEASEEKSSDDRERSEKRDPEEKDLLQGKIPSGWTRIRTAAGNEGYVHTKYLRERRDDDGYLLARFQNEQEAKKYFITRFQTAVPEEAALREGVAASAMAYLGTQYRWGGKSSQGLDCSGLVFMSYLENGVLIYRDASIREEYPVRSIPREKLKKGDLLFFPGHVAMYLGDGKYIHSTAYDGTPCVTINSLNPENPDYREDLAGKIRECGSVFAELGSGHDNESIDHGMGCESCDSKEREAGLAEDAGIKAATALTDFDWKKFQERLEHLPGKLSVVYQELEGSGTFCYRGEEPQPAASVIKLFLMAAVFQGFEEGRFRREDKLLVKRSECVPSCGVLTYLQEEQTVSLRDLVELMIIVSDNTAANLLFDVAGRDYIHSFIRDTLGMKKTAFRRKMFDSESAARGIENYVTAADVARLLEGIYRGEIVSREASREMYEILSHQRLNGKLPFYLHTFPNAPVIAHKTGEDGGITHDVGIIGGAHPFLLCFLGSETSVPEYERLMGETAAAIYQALNRTGKKNQA